MAHKKRSVIRQAAGGGGRHLGTRGGGDGGAAAAMRASEGRMLAQAAEAAKGAGEHVASVPCKGGVVAVVAAQPNDPRSRT